MGTPDTITFDPQVQTDEVQSTGDRVQVQVSDSWTSRLQVTILFLQGRGPFSHLNGKGIKKQERYGRV